MAIVSDAEILQSVKNALNITGEYQDATITEYINEVKRFMEDAGVDADLLNDSKCLGAISRGVSDLWLYNGVLSDYFKYRVTQLAYSEVVDNG